MRTIAAGLFCACLFAGAAFGQAGPSALPPEFGGPPGAPLTGVGLAQSPAGPAPPAVAASPDHVTWTPFGDPLLHAFTTEVPAGWAVQGGMVELSPVQPNLVLRLMSPDGATFILIGNPDTPNYALPSPIYPKPGFVYHPNGLAQINVVEPYTPGSQYARALASRMLRPACNDLRPAGMRDRPDVRQHAIQLLGGIPTQQFGNHDARLDSGEAWFTCTHARRPAEAHLIATTNLTSSTCTQVGCVSAGWSVPGIYGYVVPPGGAAQAEAIALHIYRAFALTPSYAQHERQLAAALDRDTEVNWRTLQQTLASEQRRIQEMDQNFQDMDDIITGIHQYQKPDGDPVWLDNNRTQWQCAGRFIGTDVDAPPRADCARLQR